jgi:hypothetical protein
MRSEKKVKNTLEQHKHAAPKSSLRLKGGSRVTQISSEPPAPELRRFPVRWHELELFRQLGEGSAASVNVSANFCPGGGYWLIVVPDYFQKAQAAFREVE